MGLDPLKLPLMPPKNPPMQLSPPKEPMSFPATTPSHTVKKATLRFHW